MQVFADLYLYHSFLHLLMQVFGPPPVKGYHFSVLFCILTHSCLFYPPHLTRTSGPLSTKWFNFLACIWHRSAPGLALTSHVVKFVHRNSHICSLDLCPRATSVCVPLPHGLACLYRDLSHACIGMSKSHLLNPYCTDDLWTTIHYPDMGHLLCHRNWLTILEFLLSSFLTPKRMKRLPSVADSFPAH